VQLSVEEGEHDVNDAAGSGFVGGHARSMIYRYSIVKAVGGFG
jgi:hypothetical protein